MVFLKAILNNSTLGVWEFISEIEDENGIFYSPGTPGYEKQQ